MEGPEQRVLQRLWQNTAYSEARINMMGNLMGMELGLAELENFKLNLLSKLKTEEMKKKGEKVTKTMIRLAMEMKMRDEKQNREEMNREKNRVRRELGEKLGHNSRPHRQILSKLRDCARKAKSEHFEKYGKQSIGTKTKRKQTLSQTLWNNLRIWLSSLKKSFRR